MVATPVACAAFTSRTASPIMTALSGSTSAFCRATAMMSGFGFVVSTSSDEVTTWREILVRVDSNEEVIVLPESAVSLVRSSWEDPLAFRDVMRGRMATPT